MIVSPYSREFRARYEYYKVYGHSKWAAFLLALSTPQWMLIAFLCGIILAAFVDQPWVH